MAFTVRIKCASTLTSETWSVDSWKQKHYTDVLGSKESAYHACGTDLRTGDAPDFELVDNVMYITVKFNNESDYHANGVKRATFCSDNSITLPYDVTLMATSED